MNTVNNTRSAASKKSIKAAFEKLLESKAPAMITVQKLCKLAGVNRTTFYAHYSNVQDLLESLKADLFSELEDHVLPNTSDALQLVNRDTMLRVLKFIRRNGTLYRLYFSQLTENKLVDYIKRKYIAPLLNKRAVYASSEFDYQFEFTKAGVLGIIKKWLSSGCKEPDESIAELIEKMLKRCFPYG
jgi:AcrR family transcriptional regulator